MPSARAARTRAAPEELPGIAPQGGFRFRRGQQAFLEKLAGALARGERHHLGVFVPGYGKTITALASFLVARCLGKAQKLVVFVPRGNLRDQYADAEALARTFASLGAPPLTFCVADSDEVFLKNLGTEIVITTYQYASGTGGRQALGRFCHAAPCLFVFDEVHHLAEDGTWARQIDGLDYACSIGLSGTPLRSDGKALFGVPHETRADGEQYYRALHEVTMRDAHAEGGILKRVDAHVVDYQLRMIREDTGEEVELSLSEMTEIARAESGLDAYLVRKRLRFHTVYLEALLEPAFQRFAQKRRALKAGREERDHQMLVIAMSNRHAAAMLAFIEERFPRCRATRIGQDVPEKTRARRLEAYRRGEIDVMVQVDMIGEGTDIKPISVIVKADLVRAYSKTMQQVFRGMRYVREFPEEANRCDLYAAGDSDVVHVLNWIASEEQVGLKIRQERAEREPSAAPAEPSERSTWHLKHVERRQMQSHTLDRPDASQTGRRPERRRQVMDVGEREKKLRKECAELASQLAYALQADGRDVAIRAVHAAAKQRFAKAQGELSIGELIRKRRWLQRCLRARRLL